MILKLKLYMLIFFLVVLINTLNVRAEVSLDDLKAPQTSFYRIGTTDEPETRPSDVIIDTTIVETKPKIKEEPKIEEVPVTYADLSIKKMSTEIAGAVDSEYNEMLEDLSLLWQGAATRSDTIKFAIYKLSNPEKDKPDDSSIKKVLSTIAGMSTFVGAGTGNPILASAALIGGNTLGIMSQDQKALNYKYTKVTDSDMILLVRKVEDLQQKVVDMYYDYMSARKRYTMTTDMVDKCYKNYITAQKSSKELIIITDTFYREALDEQMKARGNYFEKRSRLEQLVGNEIFKEFESIVDKRS